MPLRSDIWRVGIISAPITDIARSGRLDCAPITWLPESKPFSFIADPFAVRKDGRLFVFVEAYDYRTRHGAIEVLLLSNEGIIEERSVALQEPWHLSYPFVFEAQGAFWMAPEAHRSRAFTLYRAASFPTGWEPVARLELDTPAIDPTIFKHDGLWWMAYAPDGSQAFKQARLHLAYAERLEGPWRTHPKNPVRVGWTSSRPGGTPFIYEGRLTLPIQDCSRTYGGAIRLLKVETLTPDLFDAHSSDPLEPPPEGAPYVDGAHTLSACGEITLFDVKRIDHSLNGAVIDLKRRLKSLR